MVSKPRSSTSGQYHGKEDDTKLRSPHKGLKKSKNKNEERDRHFPVLIKFFKDDGKSSRDNAKFIDNAEGSTYYKSHKDHAGSIGKTSRVSRYKLDKCNRGFWKIMKAVRINNISSCIGI